MAIKKFKVMASNANKKAKSDGSCIPKSMRKDVKSGCTKKSVKANESESKFRIDIFKKDNPDALIKREYKVFKNKDEAKKYGESIADGDIVNVMEVQASCTKKSVKSARYSDARPYEDRKYWYFTTHGVGPGTMPKDLHVLEVREGQNRKGTWGDYVLLDGVLNTDELKTYDMIELAPLDSACTKKSVKAGRTKLKPHSEWSNESASRYSIINGRTGDIENGNDKAKLIRKCKSMSDPAWVEDNMLGGIIFNNDAQNKVDLESLDSSCTKKSVKSSKDLTVPKSKRKTVKASSSAKRRVGKKSIKASSPNGYSRDERFALAGEVLYRAGIANQEHGAAIAYYLPGNYVLTFNSANDEMQSPDLIFTIWNPNAKDEFDYAGILYTDLNAANRGTDATEALFNKGMGSLPEREEFSNTDDAFRKALDWVLMQARDYKSDRVWELQHGVESSKSVKKFGIKASKSAKKRKAIKASGITDDIVIYFNGDNVYQGSIYDMADAIENLCYDDEVNAKFQEWCNQFGDPFDFDGSPIDTARVFTDIIIHEAEEAPETEDGGSQFYEDGNGILDFEIFYANEGIYSAKSIKCSSSDSYNDLDETMRFRVCSYYDTKFRDLAECKVFDDFDEAVDYAHECLGNGPTTIEDYYVGTVEIDPDEYWDNFDGEFWCTPELADFRDEVWKSMGIGASKAIKCSDADGIADEWEDIREIANQDSYEYDGYDDGDIVEYVDQYFNRFDDVWLYADYVDYNDPDDWSVSASLGSDSVGSDFNYFLEEHYPELYNTLNETRYTEPDDPTDSVAYDLLDVITPNDFFIEFYPNNNQWSAPQIDIDTNDKQLKAQLEEARSAYEANRIDSYKAIQDGLGEFLANGITASTNIKAANSLNLNAKPNYTDWMLRGYKFDGEDVTTLRIDFQDDVKQAVMDMFADPDIETVDLYKIPTEQETTGVFEDEEYFTTFTREDINSSVDIEAGITVGEDSRFDFSNPIYELDDYVKAIADGVINRIQGITYDISKETIAFFDEDNNVVFVQPIGGIIPEPDDLETDINELSAAIRSEMDNAYGRDNWGQDNDDPDYSSRAVELSEDIGEVDIDDLEYVTGEDDEPADMGYGFDSNGEPIDESTVDELERIAQEVLDKSEIHNIDEYADLHNFNYYASIPYIQESFDISFTYVTDIYELSKNGMATDEGYYTTVAPYNIHFNVRCNNGEVEYAECTDVDVNDGYVKDVELKNFNLDALVQFATDLVNPIAMDIYNATTNI